MEQRRQIDRLAEVEGVSMAVVIRRALDGYLAAAAADPTQSLAACFGALPDLNPPDRGEWERG